MNKLSIIIPIYNKDKYLKKCVDSVLSQTLNDIEIILVDDGSTDKSSIICDEYAKMHSNIKVIHQLNLGLSEAKNSGLSIASGEYIGFVDADDYVNPTMYSNMYFAAIEHNADIVFSNYATNSEKGNDLKINPTYLPVNQNISNEKMRELIYSDKTGKILWFVWKSIYNRKMLLNNKIKFNFKYCGEDTVFNLEAFCVANNCWYIDEAYYVYVQTVNSIIRGGYKKNLFKELDSLYQEKIKISEKYHLSEYKSFLHYYNMTHSIVMLISNETQNLSSFSEKKLTLKKIRETKLVDEAFKNEPVSSIHSRIFLLVILLKYRCFTLLTLLISIL